MKKTPKQQPKRQPDDTPWTPPRGILYRFRPDRKNAPYFLHWRDGKTRHSASYKSDAARERAAKALTEKRSEHGTEVLTFDPKEWRQWLTFRNMVGDADPLQVAQEWVASQRSAAIRETITISEAANRYLKAREVDGIAKGTLCHAKKDMGRFVKQFGDRHLNVPPDEIRSWISALPFSDVTKRNHYKRVRAFYAWAKMDGLTAANPCENIKSPARYADDVSVLTVKHAQKLFATAWTLRPQVCARLALEAFAGLRFSSAARLVKDDINFADKGITLPAAKIKTRKRHYIDGLPSNLWKWLRAAPDEAWTITDRQYLTLKSDIFRLSDVPNPGNVLRHSFCSYHVAKDKDAARTAVILCHSNPSTLYQHYKGKATSSDAKLYFKISPASIV